MWHELEKDTVVHIAVDDWKDRTDLVSKDYKVSHPIKIYTNLPKITLSVNDVPLEVKSVENRTAVFEAILSVGKNTLVASDPLSGKVLDVAEINIVGIPIINGKLMLIDNELGVNIGSSCWFRSDNTGLSWLPDREYSEGSGFGYIDGKRETTTSDIQLTSDDPLLQSCLRGLSEYRFDLEPGDYEVELLFAELAAPIEKSAYLLGVDMGEGDSEWTNMDIIINDVVVEKGFSPGYESEGKTLVRRRYRTSAPDSTVRILFKRNRGATHLSAVKIRKL